MDEHHRAHASLVPAVDTVDVAPEGVGALDAEDDRRLIPGDGGNEVGRRRSNDGAAAGGVRLDQLQLRIDGVPWRQTDVAAGHDGVTDGGGHDGVDAAGGEAVEADLARPQWCRPLPDGAERL